MVDLAGMTPEEIDTLAAPLARERWGVERILRWLRWYEQLKGLRATERRRVADGITARLAELERIDAELAPLEAEWARRGWERYYTTLNKANAHVHRTPTCRTLREGTQVAWLPPLAGSDPSVVRFQVDPCATCFRRWV